ncbi:Predicted metal-dependent hydrolase, TIM-barrel fold [Desulfurella multipotens]|uniref:Predicted metal-dependent hydrolase, TIM-barrel fold n=1 Tax=Desulfurella multipotens TaxID=79269 RepID=A0A1G6N7B3_9BACT|nr:amidohydrolase family protein [Desulfurella multipotens]SDC63730.1 Predicted metal-dependent hydrolase, TIM-barrel fold [Desulfurella multipotens]
MQKIFDAIFHIIDYNYKIIENQGYKPPQFLPKDYLEFMSNYELLGGAIVSGSFQDFDTQYLKSALSFFGKNYVGVINYNPDYSDSDIIELDKIGVKAIRFNIKRGTKETIDTIEYASKRVFEIASWHSEIYIDSKDIESIKNKLLSIPCLVVDHLGLSKDGFLNVLNLVEKGAYVKASGFGRLDFDPVFAIKQIVSINPNACVFGSDLPSTRAQRPFSYSDIDLINNNFDDSQKRKIFYENGLNLYRLNLK